MKNKLLTLAIFLFLTLPIAFAQSTTTSVTVVDTNSQAWAGGTISYQFRPAPGFGGQYNWNGSPLPINYLTPTIISLDGSGHASFSLPSNAFIVPSGSSWTFVVCPNASISCVTVFTSVSGSSIDISSTISAALPSNGIVMGATNIPKAYGDSEVKTVVQQGGIYYNVTTQKIRFWNGTIWQDLGGGGSGGCTPSGTVGVFLYDNGTGGCSEGFIDWNVTNIHTLTLNAGNSGEVNIFAGAEDSIVLCSDPTAIVGSCPSSGGGAIELRSGTSITESSQGAMNISSAATVDISSTGGMTIQDASTHDLNIEETDSGNIVIDNLGSGDIELDAEAINLNTQTSVNITGVSGVAGGDALKQGTSPNSGAPPSGYVGFTGPVTASNNYWIPIPGTFPGSSLSAFACSGTSSPLNCSWAVMPTVISSTCNSNGCYWELSDGTKHEWGNISIPFSSSTLGTATITFPLTFSSTTYLSLGTNANQEPNGSSNSFNTYTNSVSTSGATVIGRCSVDIGGGGCSTFTGSVATSWWADGN